MDDWERLNESKVSLNSLSLSYVDGTMLSTAIPAFLTYLETKGAVASPDENDVQIIDAAFFLHFHKDLPANFGDVAKKAIHFSCDKWITPSIKGCER